MMLAAPAGNDVLYDDKLCEQGRNFCNKIWNAFRLVKGWNVADIEQPESSRLATEWFEAQLSSTLAEVKDLFGKFRLSEALMAIYRLFWDEFSSWYLEMIKPAYGEAIDRASYDATLRFFDILLRALHPFMPFITEELWQHLQERKPGESIMYAVLPELPEVSESVISAMQNAKDVIVGVRSVRAEKNISPKETLELNVLGDWDSSLDSVIKKLANLSAINANVAKDPAAAIFMIGTKEFNVPVTSSIDVEAELAKLNKDLEYYEDFLQKVLKKLSNERFVNNAPEAVVAVERNKQRDAESKIATIKASIQALQGK